MDVFLGTILPAGFNYPPAGWMLCQGQTLNISSYAALYALLGTYYGGNGIQTFALPDLRGRVLIGQGAGAGLTNRNIGNTGGAESYAMTSLNLPLHNHGLTGAPVVTGGSVQASPKGGTVTDPTGNYMANAEIPAQGSTAAINTTNYVPLAQAGTLAAMAGAPSTPVSVSLSSVTLAPAGTGAVLPTLSPALCLNYMIAVQGYFPARQ